MNANYARRRTKPQNTQTTFRRSLVNKPGFSCAAQMLFLTLATRAGFSGLECAATISKSEPGCEGIALTLGIQPLDFVSKVMPALI